ncbi:hypothetical protein ACFFK0_24500 [Paenibacillus chartarius]|uniref:DUF4025 domain-containing protein n=1 Tax=Paenibacillus chartarius TaxID=747481 RepID=A0ABV6DSE3_9BACL
MENNTHRGNYTGTTNMNAENQDMAFVNDTLEDAVEHSLVKNKQLLTGVDTASLDNAVHPNE